MNIKENKKILVLLVFLIVLFMSLVVYLSYFTIFKASDVSNNAANRRGALQEQSIKRGTIYDRNDEVLAYSDGEKGNYQRHYTYPTIYAHALGYYSKVQGKSGLEEKYNKYLSGQDGNRVVKEIKAFFDKSIDPNSGDSLKMTTDTNIQQKSRDLLDEYGEQGAIVVMNPKTGEVLSLVSYPDFNIQNIDADSAAIIERNKGELFNSATQSLFAPGSIFKIITSAAILESGINQNYTDTGEESFGGLPIKNSNQKVYGDVNLNTAFTYSINTYFANKAVQIGNKKLGEVSEKFMFNKKIDFDLPVAVSKFNYEKAESRALAESAIGQGLVTTTPFEMCLATSAIANGGKIMKPYMVSDIVSTDGSSIMKKEPEVLSEATSEENANIIKNMMISAVNKGSGKPAAIRRAQVAGKTGTAQLTSEINNAWFVGFAPAEDPQICVAVVVQNVEGLGGEVAAPIAGELIDYSLKQVNK